MKVIKDEIVLIKFKLFQLDSIPVLKSLIFCEEIDSKLVLSNFSFKGILPNKVTPNAPTQ